MSSPSEQDLQRQLDKLEAEVNSTPVSANSSESSPETVPSQLNKLVNWFNGLTGAGKLVVATVGVLVGLSILQAVLKLVASAVSLALVAGLLYLGYKFFLERRSGSGN